jgi:uncharacterized membrane protein
MLRPLLNRPYLLSAIAVGMAVYFASAPLFGRPITRALIAWDAGVTFFLCLALFFMRRVDIALIKRRAAQLDEGGHLIFLFTVIAAVASVAALVAELSLAKGQPGTGLRVTLAASTVVLSWLFVQIVFALHYAHVYYLEEEAGRPTGGLAFGDCGEPDYWDFVHFSIVLGATSQTADITFATKRMRRIGTLHTLVAFGFNTAILATMINLAASLF